MSVICYIIDCMDTYERLTCKILAMMTWASQLKTKKNLGENELLNSNSDDIMSHLAVIQTNIILFPKLFIPIGRKNCVRELEITKTIYFNSTIFETEGALHSLTGKYREIPVMNTGTLQ